jgi:hypothetical protein
MPDTVKNFRRSILFIISGAFSVLGTLGVHPSLASPVIQVYPFSDIDPYGVSPFLAWKTIETEHFNIVFPEPLVATAQRASIYLEEANLLLSPTLNWQSRKKVQVLVLDNQDSANGLTSPLAGFGMILWATPPDVNSTINFYDNWIRNLCIHEYTHFLNMDTTYGMWEILRPAFGALLLPNAVWPPWMLEGLAVYMETTLTHGGRGRGNYYNMLVRAAVDEGVLDTPDFITLDKVNGTNPYFPFGDTPYIFGYSLMERVSSTGAPGTSEGTHRGEGDPGLQARVDILGKMSENSGSRIPFFINGNLENITGKTWYDYWKAWVAESKEKHRQELEIIHSQPTSHISLLTKNDHSTSNDAEGISISRDGRYLAYTLTSADKRSGLYIKNLEKNEILWVADKMGGIGMSFFSPSSQTSPRLALLYSQLNRYKIYDFYSDLWVYDANTGSNQQLTSGLRARDPDTSQDGKWTVFTLAEPSRTLLARAELKYENGSYSIGKIETIYIPKQFDRIATPKFSKKGDKVFFTLHPNGQFQENLMELDLTERSPAKNSPPSPVTLVADGYFNRYPAIDEEGTIYFVSNRTGADNLYRFASIGQEPTLVTNVITGLSTPTFARDLVPNEKNVYASVLSSSGRNIGRVSVFPEGLPAEKLTLPTKHLPPPPHSDRVESDEVSAQQSYEDYDPLKTLAPRVWSPLFELSSTMGFGAGAEIIGFDTINRHRYTLGVSYSPIVNSLDYFALYSLRSGGLTYTLESEILTNGVGTVQDLVLYQRLAQLSARITYPILWTYSSLATSFAFHFQRDSYYAYELGKTNSNRPIYATSIYPVTDGSLTFSNQETSYLSLVSEGGRFSQLGVRIYFLPTGQVYKGLMINQEFIKLFGHVVLSPSFKAMMASSLQPDFTSSSASLLGRSLQLLNSLGGDNFNAISIRGYPGQQYYSKTALKSSLDLTFPIYRIYRGLGTLPLFFTDLYANVFAEWNYLGGLTSHINLPSYGGSLRLRMEVATMPILVTLERHQGINTDAKGAADLFFQVSGSFSF